ncbi:MAG: aminodeoxychorismate synthase component I [Bacteroidales bacterium]|nr:aminodeoxychorismate synthase component I [Bacteroidales bacterium]
MTRHFPYTLLNRIQLQQQINRLSASGVPFLFIINYKATAGYVIPTGELDSQFIRFQTETEYQQNKKETKRLLNWQTYPIPLKNYQPKFNYVQEQIHKGNSFLVNLTQPTEVQTNLSLFDLYNFGSAKYKLWLSRKFTVLSPETFVKIQDGVISSFPMKGTIDAALPNAESVILSDPKEKAEHATIVDLIRNDLSMVAGNVKVVRYRYIDQLSTNKGELLQVSSEITGNLPENYHQKLGDILFSLLPAGSISGAPKPKTLEIIEKAEGYERDFYTGIFGWFDGKNLDSGVMIRFIEQQADQLVFKSGGGITSQSELEKEYEELIQKVYVPLH